MKRTRRVCWFMALVLFIFWISPATPAGRVPDPIVRAVWGFIVNYALGKGVDSAVDKVWPKPDDIKKIREQLDALRNTGKLNERLDALQNSGKTTKLVDAELVKFRQWVNSDLPLARIPQGVTGGAGSPSEPALPRIFQTPPEFESRFGPLPKFKPADGPPAGERDPRVLAFDYHLCLEARDLDKMMQFYDFPLDFYGRSQCGQDFVRSQWKKTLEPFINSVATADSITTHWDPRGNDIVTTTTQYYYVYTSRREWQFYTGRAEYTIRWCKSGNTWRIKGVNGTTYPD